MDKIKQDLLVVIVKYIFSLFQILCLQAESGIVKDEGNQKSRGVWFSKGLFTRMIFTTALFPHKR